MGEDLDAGPMTLLRHEALYSIACEIAQSAADECSGSIESGPIACVHPIACAGAIMRLLCVSQTCSLPDICAVVHKPCLTRNPGPFCLQAQK